MKLALPIGISFYTFQTMSYTIDVYRNDAKVQKTSSTSRTYVTMFPQLIAGPIVRYQDVAEQLEYRDGTAEKFAGVQRFCIGLGKKVLLANNIGALWDTVRSWKTRRCFRRGWALLRLCSRFISTSGATRYGDRHGQNARL